MTFIFRNRTIFWDISKWNRGQKKWDKGSITFEKKGAKSVITEITVTALVNPTLLHLLKTKK